MTIPTYLPYFVAAGTVAVLIAIHWSRRSAQSYSELARIFGVCRTTAKRAKLGETWRPATGADVAAVADNMGGKKRALINDVMVAAPRRPAVSGTA